MMKIFRRKPHLKKKGDQDAAPAAPAAAPAPVKQVPRWKAVPAIPEALKKTAKKYVPFSYINKENLKRLIICLTRESSPQTIALVVSYLAPDFVREILNALPQETQARVAIEMATIHQMGQAQVASIDREIKGKVGFLIGGLDHLLKVLDQVDTFTRDNILNSLRNEQPELHAKVRKYIVLFEDIPEFPDQAMQSIVRELKSDDLAKALRNAPAEVVNKFFANMSSNAAAVLKEEMEYGRPLTPEEISEEREKIIRLIKQLEDAGKIFIREKPKDALLDGAEAAQPKGQNGGSSFTDYYNAGVQCYGDEQYEDAVSYFEYCARFQPNNPAVYQYLGGAYYALGKKAEAVAAYAKALELDPANEELKAWLNAQAPK